MNPAYQMRVQLELSAEEVAGVDLAVGAADPLVVFELEALLPASAHRRVDRETGACFATPLQHLVDARAGSGRGLCLSAACGRLVELAVGGVEEAAVFVEQREELCAPVEGRGGAAGLSPAAETLVGVVQVAEQLDGDSGVSELEEQTLQVEELGAQVFVLEQLLQVAGDGLGVVAEDQAVWVEQRDHDKTVGVSEEARAGLCGDEGLDEGGEDVGAAAGGGPAPAGHHDGLGAGGLGRGRQPREDVVVHFLVERGEAEQLLLHEAA